jgi:hypothetical protein
MSPKAHMVADTRRHDRARDDPGIFIQSIAASRPLERKHRAIHLGFH